MPRPGILGRTKPAAADREDVVRGFEMLKRLGEADLGQAAVVAGGQVLAVEAAPGTDWMLETLAGEVPGRPGNASGVLCKAPKPGQERRIDMPAIGPVTMSRAAAARLAGVAIAAGGVMVLDREEVVRCADAENLFLLVHEP